MATRSKVFYVFLIFILSVFIAEIGICQETKGNTELHNSHYIAIPFSDLVTMLRADSIIFQNKVDALNLIGRKEILYASESALKEYDNIGKVGVGHFMFKNIPTLVKYSSTLHYSFPIYRLSYYKFSILNRPLLKFREQSCKYNDLYNINYIEEVYYDNYNKIKYELEYHSEYGCLTITKY